MARQPQRKTAAQAERSESAIILQPPRFVRFELWMVGDTPLITHAWSEKAKREMLAKQVREIKAEGREQRNPQQDFVDSLYEMGNGKYGFPVSAFKSAIEEVAHVDRGIPKTHIKPSIWFNHEIVRVRPALAGAVCDMPLVQIISGEPEMREDMVRIGSGIKKTATLAYRAQFWPWAVLLRGRVNEARVSLEALTNLLLWAGMECGIGEWRTERSGVMGSFHPADEAEVRAWSRYQRGNGPLPTLSVNQEAAD